MTAQDLRAIAERNAEGCDFPAPCQTHYNRGALLDLLRRVACLHPTLHTSGVDLSAPDFCLFCEESADAQGTCIHAPDCPAPLLEALR